MKSANSRKRFLLVLAAATRRNRIFGSEEIRMANNNAVIFDDGVLEDFKEGVSFRWRWGLPRRLL